MSWGFKYGLNSVNIIAKNEILVIILELLDKESLNNYGGVSALCKDLTGVQFDGLDNKKGVKRDIILTIKTK